MTRNLIAALGSSGNNNEVIEIKWEVADISRTLYINPVDGKEFQVDVFHPYPLVAKNNRYYDGILEFCETHGMGKMAGLSNNKASEQAIKLFVEATVNESIGLQRRLTDRVNEVITAQKTIASLNKSIVQHTDDLENLQEEYNQFKMDVATVMVRDRLIE